MDNELTISIKKDPPSQPWGFRLHGGVDLSEPLMISNVSGGSVCDGQLMEGDMLMELCGHSTAGMTHHQASEQIRTAGTVLNMKVMRDPRKMPWLLRDRGADATAGPLHQYQSAEPHYNKVPPVPPPKNRVPSPTRHHQPPPPHHHQPLPHHHQPPPHHHPPPPPPPHSLYRAQSPPDDPMKQFGTTYGESPTGHYVRQRPSVPLQKFAQPSTPHDVRSPIYVHTEPNRTHSSTSTHSPHISLKDGVIIPQSASGRSSPTTVPNQPGNAVGVWTPPAAKPHSRLVHLQYNSPLNMYSAENVADMIETTTGTKLQWASAPHRYKDISESPTYQYIQEMEKGSKDVRRPVQSSAVTALERRTR